MCWRLSTFYTRWYNLGANPFTVSNRGLGTSRSARSRADGRLHIYTNDVDEAWYVNCRMSYTRKGTAPLTPQAKHQVTSGTCASTAPLSRSHAVLWPTSAAAGGCPRARQRDARPRFFVWKVKVPVNRLSSCQTAAAACRATCRHQLGPSVGGGQITQEMLIQANELSSYWKGVWLDAGLRAVAEVLK